MRVVYLTYETKSREFIGYQEMAHHLIDSEAADYVFIGDKYIFERLALFNFLIKGIFMLKSAQSHLKKKLKKLRKNGFNLVVQDSEAVCDYELDGHHDCFMKPGDSLRYINTIFTSLNSETKTIKKLNPKLNVSQTGYMRFNHLMNFNLSNAIYADEINLIKKLYGRHILIVSSGTSWKFGYDKNFDELSSVKNQGIEDWHMKKLIHFANYSHISLFGLFDFIRMQISNKDSKYKILFRPHPTEDEELYKRLFAGLDSIHVDKSFSLPSSIFASSKVILSPNSTTSFECSLLEKESFCLMPKSELYEDWAISNHITSELSTIVQTPLALYNQINKESEDKKVILKDRKNKVIKFTNISKNTMQIFCDEIKTLFAKKRIRSNSNLIRLELQKLVLKYFQKLYKVFLSIDFLKKSTSYGKLSIKLVGEMKISSKILDLKFPSNKQEFIGDYLVVSRKK